MHPYTIMGLAWVFCIVWVTFVIMTNKNSHPKALFFLFFVEMWERFSYYGMRALLVLYMTEGMLEYSHSKAYGVYGAYGAMVYATPLIGGLLAEKFMGYRKSIMWGAILMMVGHFLMAFEHEYIFFTALALLIMGNGFFKPNISSMIGKFYGKKDPSRDGAFTIFYMGINIGAFLSGLTCGVIGEIEGWHYGFSLAGFGMLLGLIIFYAAQKNGALEDKGYAPHEVKEIEQPDVHEDDLIQKYELIPDSIAPKYFGLPANWLIYICSLIAIPLIWMLIRGNDILDIALLIIASGMIGYLIYLSFQYEKVQRQRIWVIITLFFSTIIFWTFFELAGSALTIFTANNVKKPAFLTTTMFQSFNPFFIMIFAPIFSWMWIKLAQMKKEPPAPVKFGIGLVLLGLGFLVLNLGGSSAENGLIPAIFIVFLYLLHTLGELTLSPVGLSLVTKLAPLKIVGFVMGFWMMSSSLAHQAGKHIAQMTDVDMSVLLEDEERAKRFETNMASEEKVRTAFFDNKDFYKMYVGASKEDEVKKFTQDTTLIEEYQKDHEVNEFLVSDFFIEKLNTGLAQPEYFVGQLNDKKILAEITAAKAKKDPNLVYIKQLTKDAKHTFLTKDPTLVLNTPDSKPLAKSEAEIKAAINAGPGGVIQSSIAQDTLVICLDVFMLLGFIAIGAGILLMLASIFVSKWMHGIK